jgi:hypothetical protein
MVPFWGRSNPFKNESPVWRELGASGKILGVRSFYSGEPHTANKNWSMYSQKWNCAASFPVSTFMYLWAIYIFPRSVRLFCCNKIGGYMNVGTGTEAAQFHFLEYLFEFAVHCLCNATWLFIKYLTCSTLSVWPRNARSLARPPTFPADSLGSEWTK